MSSRQSDTTPRAPSVPGPSRGRPAGKGAAKIGGSGQPRRRSKVAVQGVETPAKVVKVVKGVKVVKVEAGAVKVAIKGVETPVKAVRVGGQSGPKWRSE